MLRGSPMEAESQFPAQLWSKGSGLRALRECVREAKPCKHCFRLSIINSKVWSSLTDLQGVEERLVTDFDSPLMKCVTFANALKWLLGWWALPCTALDHCCPRVRGTSDTQLVSGITCGAVSELPACGCLGESWQDSSVLLLSFRLFCFGHFKWVMDEFLVWILKSLKNYPMTSISHIIFLT